MSDWGKFVIWVLEKMPWVAFLALAVFVFVPEACVPEFALEFRKEWRAVAFWSLLVIAPIVVLWFNDQWRKNQEKASAEMAIWEKFTRLHPKTQMFVIHLFFSGRMSEAARFDDPIVSTLVAQGFLTVINDGMVSSNDSGKLVVTVMVSQSMQAFMEKYSEEFRELADRIMSS